MTRRRVSALTSGYPLSARLIVVCEMPSNCDSCFKFMSLFPPCNCFGNKGETPLLKSSKALRFLSALWIYLNGKQWTNFHELPLGRFTVTFPCKESLDSLLQSMR